MVSPCKGWGLQKAQRSVGLHRRAYRPTLLRMLYTGLGFDKQNASDADEAEMIVAHWTGDAEDTGNYKVSVFHFDALAIYFTVKTVAFSKLWRQIWPFVEPKLMRVRTQMALAGTAPAVAITYVLDGAPSRRLPDEREFRTNKRAVEELAARSPTVQEAPRPTGAESIRTGKREETSRSRTEEILHAQLASGQAAGAQLDEAEARAHQPEFLCELEKAYSSGLKDNLCPLEELVGTSVDDLLVRLRKEDNVHSAETGRAGAREYVQVSLGCCRAVDPTKRMQLKCNTSTTRPSLQHAIVHLVNELLATHRCR
ncbi:hypothetical protein T492DRAFT_894151, partial [Pavlovales sp. CCMP2436]